MNQQPIIISIFDLDGTLSKKDTYLPYLMGFLLCHPRRWLRGLMLPFAVLMHYLKIRDNQWLKEFFLHQIFRGIDKEKLCIWNNHFLNQLFTSGLRSDIVDLLKKRQQAGDIIILATASLDIYVPDIADRFNISNIICTGTEWRQGQLTGRLKGKNCYGPEKLHRVKAYLKEHGISGEIHVYSDHSSDWPLMQFSDKAHAVYPTPELQKLAQLENINIINSE